MKKLFSALFILLFGFIGIGTSGNIVKASTMVEQTSEMAKTFSQLTPEEQSYFKSKGFSDKDTFYTQKIEPQDPKTRFSANVLRLTASTKKITNTQGRTEYIITSPNSAMYRICTRLSLGSAKSYTQTVNLANSYGYGGGMYFTFTWKRQYYSVKLAMQVYNTFGVGSVSCTAGGLTIGK